MALLWKMNSLAEGKVPPVTAQDRMFGLDVCRAAAILSVVLGHMFLHSSPNPYLAEFGFLAIFGVDLFFCLSGFLIGRILLTESEKWAVEQDRGLMRFWYRRWMRTVPLYAFFFMVELYLYRGGMSSVSHQSSYLVFAQNLAWPMPDFYRLTWSLAVEEWFYLLFPLLMFMLIGLGARARRAAVWAIVAFLLVPLGFRLALFDPHGTFDTLDPHVRHVVLFRLDAIGCGVAVAYLARWHVPVYERMIRFWWVFALMAAVCMAYIKWSYFGFAQGKLAVGLYFTGSAIAFAGLIPALAAIPTTQWSGINRFIRYTSLTSYSLYLGHIVAFMVTMELLRRMALYNVIYPNPWLAYPLFLMAAYSLATVTYYLIERPLLALRDRRSHSVQSADKSLVFPLH